MNAPKRTSTAPTIVALNLALLLPLATGCGKEKAANNHAAEPAAVTQSTLPPITPTPSQADLALTPAVEPSNAVVATFPPTPATNGPAVPTPAPSAGSAKEYTVAKGDTLYKIARVNKVKVSALTKANPAVDFAKLKAGQKIKIPAASTSVAATGGLGLREPSLDGANVHVVKAGETLTQLAKLNHTTIKAIQDANGLKTTRVNVGQKIKIPTGTQSAPAATTPKATTTAPKPAETI